MKIKLMEILDNAVNDELFADSWFYWWENEIERMADAALNVRFASIEAQTMIRNETQN